MARILDLDAKALFGMLLGNLVKAALTVGSLVWAEDGPKHRAWDKTGAYNNLYHFEVYLRYMMR